MSISLYGKIGECSTVNPAIGAEAATIEVLKDVASSGRGGHSCVQIYGVRGKENFHKLVDEVSKRIPKPTRKALGLPLTELRKIVRAILEQLRKQRMVFTNHHGRWVLRVQNFREWLMPPEEDVETPEGRSSRRPLSYTNCPRRAL